jgi:hypothetical protein
MSTPSSMLAAPGDGEWPPPRMANLTSFDVNILTITESSSAEAGLVMHTGVSWAVADLF